MNLTEASRMARSLMNEHGLSHWHYKFDNAKRRFGCCSYYERTISQSRYLVELNSVEVVRQNMLHEIAHALVGPGHNHDAVWRRKARELGHTGDRCYDPKTVVRPPAPYMASCKCGVDYHRRHKDPNPTAKFWCKRCKMTLRYVYRRVDAAARYAAARA